MLRYVFVAACVPLIWTRRIVYHRIATAVVLLITLYRLFQQSLH